MTSKEKLEIRRFEKYWKNQGRKNLFIWIHRFLRLHSELLVDSVYQNMYEYHRNTLIAYLKKDADNKKFSDTQLGELVDVLADIFNKKEPKKVNKYKSLLDNLYNIWKTYPSAMTKIRI